MTSRRTNQRTRIWTALAGAALAWLAGCGGEAGPVETGLVRCRVVLDRAPTSLPTLHVDKNADHCGDELANPLLVPDRIEVRDVLVAVDWSREEPNETPSTLTLRGKGCLFEPRIQLARKGDLLEVGSGDEFTHNPHAWREDETTLFNLTILNSTFRFNRRLSHSGTVRVDCDTHKWMRAYIHVMEHPYAALTDEMGVAELDAPAGRRTLRVWHELLGETEVEVDVRAGEITETSVTLSLADRRNPAHISPNEDPWTP